MASRSRRDIVIAWTLLSMASCAGPDAPREPFPSGGVIPTPPKHGTNLGVPWEKQFGTKGAVRVRETIFVAAQLSWDEQGTVKGDTIEAQMRLAYANIRKLLEPHGAQVKDIIEETMLVMDMKGALAVAQQVRQEVFGESPTVASSIVGVTQLADPKALVAVRVTAKLDIPIMREPSGNPSGSRPRGGGGRSRSGMGGGISPF